MKKILIIDLHCDALLPSGLGEFGGGNAYSKSVIKTIINTDIEYLYITRKKIDSLLDEEKIASNLTYVRIKIAQDEVDDKDTLFKYSDEILSKISNLIDTYHFTPDLIHSIYWPSGIIAQKMCSYFHIPFIHTILSNGKRKLIQSGNYEIANIRIRNEEECFRNAKYIICSSLYELEDIRDLYGIPSEKLVLTGLEIDKVFTSPAYNNAGKYILNSICEKGEHYISIDKSSHDTSSLWWNKGAFLFYGRLHPDKGIIAIINNWLELKTKYPNFPVLWIAGGSPEQIYQVRESISDKELLAYFEELQEIIWWGRLPAEGLSTLMLKTLVLVTHSRYESGGLMILEAMAQGVPVIATPFGYARDYVEDWKNGFLVPFDDYELLKRRMLHFFYQPFLSSVLGENAKKRYKEIAAEFNFSNKHIELYRTNEFSHAESYVTDLTHKTELPYPITEYIPNDDEVLSFFLQHMQNNTWNNEGIPVLKKSEDYEEYHVWTIEYNTENYQCFRWKSHINKNRVFTEKTDYFYTSNTLLETDKLLYNLGICPSPLNLSLDYNISIHRLSHSENSFINRKESFRVMFESLSKIRLPLPKINFQEMLKESVEILHNYGYCVDDIFPEVYNALSNSCLKKENLGLVPTFLHTNSFINNQFAHVGRICKGTESYFYAQYLFLYNKIQKEFVQSFFQENNIDNEIHKNIIYWLLNLLYNQISKDKICNTSNIVGLSQMEELISLLEQYD